MKRRVRRVLWVLFDCVFIVFMLEAGVRRFRPEYNPSGHLRIERGTIDRPPLGEPNTRHRHVKNTGEFNVSVCFNRHGFRDTRDVADSTPSDIVVAGDSFAFGWGVEEEERFSSLLDEGLAEDVYNIGMPSSSVDTDGRLLEYARDCGLRATNLIVAVCMENDLMAYGRYAGEAAPATGGGRVRSYLKSHSAAYFAFTCLVHQRPRLRDAFVKMGLVTPAIEGMPKNAFDTNAVQATVEAIGRLADGSHTTVLIIPSRALWMGDNRDVEERVHAAFLRELETVDAEIVDLKPGLEAGGDPLSYHFATDGHWTAGGHRLAAEALLTTAEDR